MSSMTDASKLARSRIDRSRSEDTERRPDADLHQAADARHEDAMRPVAAFLDVLKAGDHPNAREKAKAARIEASAVRHGHGLIVKRHVLSEVQKIEDPVVRTAFYLVVEETDDFDEALNLTARLVEEAKATGDTFNGPLLRQWLRTYFRPSPQTLKAAMDGHRKLRKEHGMDG